MLVDGLGSVPQPVHSLLTAVAMSEQAAKLILGTSLELGKRGIADKSDRY